MTALSATFQAGTAVAPARVLLNVTAAPSVTPPYKSAFTVGNVDGWTGNSGVSLAYQTGYTTGPPPVTVPVGMKITTIAGSGPFTASRTITGLTIGETYLYSMMVITTLGKITLGVTGIGTGAQVQPPAGARTPISYTFTATATTHVITIGVMALNEHRVDTILVARTSNWGGTTIYRTDANGSLVPVREAAGGQDTVGTSGSATMTVTDYEAALVGSVFYTVVDGLGASATANFANPANPGVWVTLPATSDPGAPVAPAFVQPTMMLTHDETSESNGSIHKIVGRADPLVNPGPLSYRSGTMDIFCASYAEAKKLRDLLAPGAIAQIRQHSFPGMDLYFSTDRLTVSNETITSTQRWKATLDFVEVLSP